VVFKPTNLEYASEAWGQARQIKYANNEGMVGTLVRIHHFARITALAMPWREGGRLFLRLAWVSLFLAASMSVANAADQCKLMMYPLPINMEDRRPVISAAINGTEERFMVDTGSFFDFLSPAVAAGLKLQQESAPPWYQVSGVGGSSFVPRIATAKTFTVAGWTAHDAQFLVGDNDMGGGIAGILGQNLFRNTAAGAYSPTGPARKPSESSTFTGRLTRSPT
jgi:hypothetical protein